MGAAGSSEAGSAPCPAGARPDGPRQPRCAPPGGGDSGHTRVHTRPAGTHVSHLPSSLASAPRAPVLCSRSAGTRVRGERARHRPGPSTASHTRRQRIRASAAPGAAGAALSGRLSPPRAAWASPAPEAGRTRLGAVVESAQRALTALRRRRRARLPAVPRAPLLRRVGSAPSALRPRPSAARAPGLPLPAARAAAPAAGPSSFPALCSGPDASARAETQGLGASGSGGGVLGEGRPATE